MIKLSASSIGTYEKCPKKYHYHYIEKPDVPKQDWSHLEVGKCIHRVLELFHEDLLKNIKTPAQYPILMKECFQKAVKEFDLKIIKDDLPNIKQMLKDYMQVIDRDGLPKVINNELSFEFKIEDFTVRGFIDRIDDLGDNHYCVVDYKTNKNPKYLTNFQLLLYALALKEKFPKVKTISGKYILLKNESKTLDYTFKEQDFKDTYDKVVSIGKSIDMSKEWEKKPSILCNWCDYQSICQGNWTE